MIRAFIKRIADRSINRTLAHERRVEAINLYKAKNIGILVNGMDKANYLEYRKLVNELESKKSKAEIHALIWFKGKTHPEYIKPTKQITLYSKLGYNLLFKPKKKSETINRFIGNEFDLLIDLTRNDIYPLRKVLSLCQSSFKVGSLEVGNEPFYDFMIKFRSTKDYTLQIVHYLSLLNKNA